MSRNASGGNNVVSLLGAFVAASMVLGLLGAGIFMPAVGAAGLGVKEAVSTFDDMPATFTASPLAQESKILASDGTVIARLYEENRTVVPFDKISQEMKDAQIAIEDSRYYEHGGLDARGLARAIVATVQGDKQGASTITQQYVKQTRIYQCLKADDKECAEAAQARGGVKGAVRKLQEAKYAIALEKQMKKDDILEGYLNLVYYGAGAYGVEAAAQRYFGVHASELDLPQAALIAGMAQRPTATNPFEFPDAALARRTDVLRRMQQTGFISAKRAKKAMNTPIKLRTVRRKASCPASKDPYFCDYVIRWLEDQPSLGKDREERHKAIFRGGLTIRTTYDIKLADQMRKTLTARLPIGAQRNRGTAAAVVQPGTGKVLAFAQNTKYVTGKGDRDAGETTVNWSVDQKYGASGGFQIGSTAKTFAVVAALEKGMTARSRIDAPAAGTRYSVKSLGGDKCGKTGASWGPGNAESNEHGNMSLATATAKSVNTAFAELASRIGVCSQQEVMARMGLHNGQGEPYGGGASVANVVLGGDNASPLTLASSYATLAAGGKYCEPVPVEKITSFENKDFAITTAGCKQVISPKVAYDTTKILQGVFDYGTAKKFPLAGDRPAAGKTGTSDESVHTWFAGYTPQLAAAVWVGRPYAYQAQHGVYGGTIAGPLWKRIVDRASADMPVKKFTRPASDSSKSQGQAQVPDVTGRSRSSAERKIRDAGFEPKVADYRYRSSSVDRGRVAATKPEADSQADKGSTVEIILSKGSGDSGNGDSGNGDSGDSGDNR